MNATMARVLCAHCKEYHGSIDEVRFCAANHHARTTFAPPARPAYVTLRENAGRDSVPDGHYAIWVGDIVEFYRVRRPTEGKWVGRVFVDRQAGDDYHPTYDRSHRQAILSDIGQDVKAASIRYGQEIGRCGVCNRTLTNDVSRAAGIGRVCAGRLGW